MAEPSPEITSIRSILNNVDYLSNWLTVFVVSGSFSILISMKERMTGASIFISFFSSTLLAMTGWPVLLQYGYGGLGIGLLYGMICGLSGITVLLTMIGIINRVYTRRTQLADKLLEKGGLPPELEKSDDDDK